MFCCDTGSIPAIHIDKMVRVEMTVQEAQEIVPVVENIRYVRSSDHGNGYLTIPLINGFLEKIEAMRIDYPPFWQWLKSVGKHRRKSDKQRID